MEQLLPVRAVVEAAVDLQMVALVLVVEELVALTVQQEVQQTLAVEVEAIGLTAQVQQVVLELSSSVMLVLKKALVARLLHRVETQFTPLHQVGLLQHEPLYTNKWSEHN
jgi:hypothetical protein